MLIDQGVAYGSLTDCEGVGSKGARRGFLLGGPRRLSAALSAQTNRQTDKHYENNGHLALNQKFHSLAYTALHQSIQLSLPILRSMCFIRLLNVSLYWCRLGLRAWGRWRWGRTPSVH